MVDAGLSRVPKVVTDSVVDVVDEAPEEAVDDASDTGVSTEAGADVAADPPASVSVPCDADEQAVAAKAVASNRMRSFTDAHHRAPPYIPLSTSAMSSPIWDGLRATRQPAFSRAAILAAAVPFEPDTMAPAWPIFFPGGAVTPAT